MSRILKVEREEEFIRYTIETKGHMAAEDRIVKCHEAPLEDFDKCLQCLKQVVIDMMDATAGWQPDIIVRFIQIKWHGSGARKVTLGFKKYMHRSTMWHKMKTQAFWIDDDDDGDIERQCVEYNVDLINNFLHEADKYIAGERQQQLLPIEEEVEQVEPSDGDQMDFGDGDLPLHKRVIPMHPDTDIPDLGGMEQHHATWYVDLLEDKADLKQLIKFNFDEKLDGRLSLSDMKAAARELIFNQ